MSAPSYTVTNDTITVIVSGETFTVTRGSKNFDAARKAILAEQWDTLPGLLSPGLAVKRWLGDRFTFVDHFICYNGERIDTKLNERLLKMVEEGSNPTAWLKFWERLQRNPSFRSVNQLYAFLTHEGIPVDDEGYLLTYKSVSRDYKDHHTGTFDNSPGQTHEMPRNKISDDPKVACHEGFHVGALGYAQTFGGDGKRIIVCRVDPADVVCVPYDSSQQKVRVCKYTVLGNYSGMPLPSTTFREDLDENDDPYRFAEDDEESDEVEDLDENGDPCDENDGYDGMPERRDASPEELAEADDQIADLSEDPWAKFHAMGEGELLSQSIRDLRQYATHSSLKIVGASKLPNGKQGIVERILEVRRK